MDWEPVEIVGDVIERFFELNGSPDVEVVENNETNVEPTNEDLTADRFIDQEIIRNFECLICLGINRNTVICTVCSKPICNEPCFQRLLQIPRMRQRCPHCRSPFNFTNRASTGPNSKETFDNLQCHCKFNSRCNITVSAKDYTHHINSCKYNVRNCAECSTKNESQEHHLNACSSELSSLRREIETLKQQLTETTQSQLEILSSNSTLIENLNKKLAKAGETIKRRDEELWKLKNGFEKIAAVSSYEKYSKTRWSLHEIHN